MKNWAKKYWYLLVGVVAIPVVFAALPADEIDTLEKMEVAQEAYFQTHGKYLQILPDNRLPHYENGTVREKLGKIVAPGYRVDVYRTYKGEHGWQATWEDANNRYIK